MAEPLATAEQIADVLGCSARSVLRQFERGRIPGYRVSAKRVRFDTDEVLAALRVGATAPDGR